VFVRVALCGGVQPPPTKRATQKKLIVPGVSAAVVAAAPVPLRETVCGLPGASSVTESVPLRVSELVGVKVTLMVQVAPEARLETQLLLSPKLVLAAIPEMLSAVVP
jgi:hypothetical protein